MGLFGSTQIYVASTVYNLAGDELKRVQYLKSTVIGSIISDNNFSPVDMIMNSYLPGPGIIARSFFNWSLINYQPLGVPLGSLGGVINIDPAAIVPFLTVPAGTTAAIQSVDSGLCDYSYWAEQWMIINRPALMGTAWSADLTPDFTQIKITFADATTITFTPIGFERGRSYIYVVYTPIDTVPATPPVVHDSIYWFYKVGSGNATLDAAVAPNTSTPGEWFPSIPFRINKTFLSNTFDSAAYVLAQSAYRKATTRKKYSVMIDTIANNASLADIDHAYMMYGVCLNVREQACRQYIYKLFDRVLDTQEFGSAAANSYSTAQLAYIAGGRVGNAPIQPVNNLRIRSTSSLIQVNLDIEIRWTSMSRMVGTGLVRPGIQKARDYWIEKGGTTVAAPTGTINAGGVPVSFTGSGTDLTTIYHQVDDNRWTAIQIGGWKHLNHIYQDKSVEITAAEALDAPDDTGFVIPLHYETLRKMSLVASTQLMTAGTFIIFNSYKIVKQKWYQTGIFKIFLFLVIIAITVAFPPAGGLVGVLGSAAAVGAAVGLSGLIAVIVGAIINALVAMIIAKIIGMVSVKLFGPKWGAIIGAIVSTIALSATAGLMNGQSLSQVWGSMMSASSIINMTSAVGDGISGYLAASVAGIGNEMLAFEKKAGAEQKSVNDKLEALLGGRATLDPMMWTDAGSQTVYESENTFLSRTLMTGTDIADMTLDMLTNYTDYTLATPILN